MDSVKFEFMLVFGGFRRWRVRDAILYEAAGGEFVNPFRTFEKASWSFPKAPKTPRR